MKYLETDKTIRIGDHVVYGGAPAVIVFVIDDDSYSNQYPKENWSYLDKGLGVEVQDAERTLYLLDAPDEDLEPLSSENIRTMR